MKKLPFNKSLFIPAAVAFALVLGCAPQNASAQMPPAPAATDASAPRATPVVPPPNIVPGSPFAEVVRLAQAGVDEGIIMAYVANSASTFNLDSDKIIYLSNLGVPNTVVTAMIQRDQQLQQQFSAAQAAQQQPPAQPATVSETAPTDTAAVTPAPAPDQPATTDYFYDTLSPYGNWVVVNGYGRCWRPTIVVYNSSWQPYCDHGHWVYTDCGWFWASDYAWGATFHYGRWFRDADYGWCWYPDPVWAPSWVTWRYSNNYCGWAPLPPRTSYVAGVGIVFNGGGVGADYNFGLAANCFTFVPAQHFCDPHPHHYFVARTQVAQIYNNTRVINNYNVNNRTIVNQGIAVENIAVATRTTIRPIPVRQMDTVVVHGGHSQPSNRSSYGAGVNHVAYTRDFGSPLRTPASPQNTSPQPQQHYNPAVTIPQHPVPVVNYHSQPQAAPTQTQPVYHGNASPQPAWQQMGSPRNAVRNQSQPNYYQSSAMAAPQSPAARPPAPLQPQHGGNSNGDKNWAH